MMDLIEIETKSALVKSRIPGVDFVVNPFIGCGHACLYCYASFMAKHSHGHAGAKWGTFVEVKANIAQVLRDELSRKRKRGTALLSSVCDPYQPVEAHYEVTRRCVEALRDFDWGIEILTRSPLVTRDLALFSSTREISVGFSIPTDSDQVRQVVEPHAPPISERIAALRTLHGAGVSTWVFIAPMLPMNPKKLHEAIEPYVERVLMDGLNYPAQVRSLFHKHHWDEALTKQYAADTAAELTLLFGRKAVRV